MALQLLKRNYVMDGYEQPRILKLPQGEYRESPRRLPVDIGDVMMNIRMDDSKNKYIGEHISKYAQGLNPYGEWGSPYKINKNNIRPPIIDPKFYASLSRMPVKFDSVTAGPIVKQLYQKKVEISKIAPKNIVDKVCPEYKSRPVSNPKTNMQLGAIELHLKQPRASIPYHPSMPVHLNTGVPEIELDPKIMIRPNMGIHAPFMVSDQSRDVFNMRTPMHVAVKPGYKDPYTFIQATPENVSGINESLQHVAAGTGFNPGYTLEPEINTTLPLQPGIQTAAQTNIIVPAPVVTNVNTDTLDLTPKVRTSAWYNPNYFLTDLSGYSIGSVDKSCVEDKVQTSAGNNPSYRWTNLDNVNTVDPQQLTDRVKTNAQAKPTMNILQLTEQQIADNVFKNRMNTAVRSSVSYKMVDNDNRHPEMETVTSDKLQLGKYDPRSNIPTVQAHQTFTRVAPSKQVNYYFIENHGQHGDSLPHMANRESNTPTRSGIRNKLQLQEPRVDRNMEPAERVIPVGTGRFVYPTM
jgi:hypothetical protein